eukprot:6588145-Pyramimonas_sp.AAC.1
MIELAVGASLAEASPCDAFAPSPFVLSDSTGIALSEEEQMAQVRPTGTSVTSTPAPVSSATRALEPAHTIYQIHAYAHACAASAAFESAKRRALDGRSSLACWMDAQAIALSLAECASRPASPIAERQVAECQVADAAASGGRPALVPCTPFGDLAGEDNAPSGSERDLAEQRCAEDKHASAVTLTRLLSDWLPPTPILALEVGRTLDPSGREDLSAARANCVCEGVSTGVSTGWLAGPQGGSVHHGGFQFDV